jgi:hypothetical protein
MFITESRYEKTPQAYKGIFKNLGEHADMEHLVGKRSYLTLGDHGTCLVIEGASLCIIPDGFEEKAQREIDSVWGVWGGENKIIEIKHKRENSFYVLYYCGRRMEYIIHSISADEDVKGLHYGTYMENDLQSALNQLAEMSAC